MADQAASRVTVVTGGGNGIGAAVAAALGERGDRVVVSDITLSDAERTAKNITDAKGEALAVRVDITDPASIDDMFTAAAAAYGYVDTVVNIAGAWLRPKSVGFQSFREVTVEDWRWVTSVNLEGTFNMCKAAAEVLIDHGSGKIVNMASATFFGGTAGLSHYVSAKAGVIGLTRVLARELGPFGIQVNAVAPGAILTDDDPSDEVIADHRKRAESRSIKRIGTAADVVGPVLFLASSQADFVTGQTIVIDGGVVMH